MNTAMSSSGSSELMSTVPRTCSLLPAPPRTSPAGRGVLRVQVERRAVQHVLATSQGRPLTSPRCPGLRESSRSGGSRLIVEFQVWQYLAVNSPTDIRLSFNEAADIYDRARPSYPPHLFDAFFQLLPPAPQIVEVGPGTGKATKDLLVRGASVHAIEIGPAMAGKLRSNLPSDRLRVTIGDFEDVSIAPNRADAVFSATAYHWVSQEAQTDRPATLLRRGGIVAIVDLIQVDSPDDAGFFAASQGIYERYGHGHTGPPARPVRRPTRRSGRCSTPTLASTLLLYAGTTGTRATAQRTIGNSCCPTRARR